MSAGYCPIPRTSAAHKAQDWTRASCPCRKPDKATFGGLGQYAIAANVSERRAETYPIQVGLDVPVGVDRGLLAPQLVDAADDSYIAANVAVEERSGNAWGGCVIHVVREGEREGIW